MVERYWVVLGCLAACLCWVSHPSSARAFGEEVGGFPNYTERVLHVMTNRARVEPDVELAGCSGCIEAHCYVPEPPLYYKRELNRAARFHADEMRHQRYFDHRSQCTVVENISELYPERCDGSAECACVGGVSECGDGGCTGHQRRVQLFGTDYRRGEIIAGGGGSGSFYLWLRERGDTEECRFTYQNGHRWVLLKSGPAVGFGTSGTAVGEFGTGGEVHPIPAGIHMEGSFWANWYDEAGPSRAMVNVEGACQSLSLERGSPENGAYSGTIEGGSSTCRRYYFVFESSGGEVFTYPTTGSLGLGTGESCATWSNDRPTLGSGCATGPGGDPPPPPPEADAGGSGGGGDGTGGESGSPSSGPSDGGTTSDARASGTAPGGDRALHGSCAVASGAGPRQPSHLVFVLAGMLLLLRRRRRSAI